MSEVNKDADSNELQVFVSETLCAVMAAVNDVRETAAIASAKGTGRYVFKAPNEIEFDIAVMAKRTAHGGGKLKLEVFSVGVSGSGEKSAETSTISRIKFKIPRTFLEGGRNE